MAPPTLARGPLTTGLKPDPDLTRPDPTWSSSS